MASRSSSQTASPVPKPPASTPSSVVSVSNRPTRDPCEAPSARRNAISSRRSSAHASSKLARLVQASSTSPATALSSHAAAGMKSPSAGRAARREGHDREQPGRRPVLAAVPGEPRGHRPDRGFGVR